MKYGNIELTGSLDISGSFTVPSGTTLPDVTGIPNGSLFFHTADNVLCGLVSGSWSTMSTVANSDPYAVPISYLVVAGGGGGGGWGGGGGAGGLLSGSTTDLSSGSVVTVTVGAGSVGGQLSQNAGGYVQGVDGGNSSLAATGFTTVTAIGGGGGGKHDSSTPAPGRPGGSGGGAGMSSTGATLAAGGAGTSGQGYAGGAGGGASTYYYRGGGGGGASEVGGLGGVTNGYSAGGIGGDGLASTITGTSVTYAGGGGSHTDRRGGGGVAAGGSGGGGAGGGYNPMTHAADGTTNTGGGGGGSYGYSTSHQGGGGSGVAVISYNSGSFNCAGGIVGDAGNGRKSNQFNSSGTFKVGSTSNFEIVTGNNLQLYLDAGNFASRGTSTWTDLSGNGNNGTVNGATLTGTHYTFDGSNDSVTLAEGDESNTTPHSVYGTFTGASETNWTLECWFRTSENDSDTWGTPIIGRDSGDLFGQLIVKDNKVHYLHANPNWLYVTSTSNVTDNTWHHVVLVNYTNATMDLWLDGVKEATAVSSTVYYSVDTRYFKLSHVAKGYNGDHTACEVAQIRLYDTNLSDAEVLQNYNATKTNFI